MVDIFTSSFSSNSDSPSVNRLIKWNNDNLSCIILNIDGSCLGSPVRAGYEGIIRNNSGFYLSGFSGFIRESFDILLAELYAIFQDFLIYASPLDGILDLLRSDSSGIFFLRD
ncbi:ribonuclease H [Trifolium pratense]|uniref:Ribonuclease H n=1 Tax=Trifolium pratense TaxID=57577 RepID=A0A2K3PHV5_TRIPR|nr:ribonuclease H [Trifolium pratense]